MTEIKKPTTFAEGALLLWTNESNCYDQQGTGGDETTMGYQTLNTDESPSIRFHTWEAKVETYTATVLKLKWKTSIQTGDDEVHIEYTKNGGGAWADLLAKGVNRSVSYATAQIALDTNQDLTQVEVRVNSDKVKGADGCDFQISDIWTEGTYTEAQEFVYGGNIPAAILSSYTSIGEMVFSGTIGLVPLTSSTRILDRIYSGITATNLLPSYASVMEYPYAGSLPVSLTPSAVYSLNVEYSYSGSVQLVLLPSYASILDRVYSGTIGLSLLPSYTSILDRIYSGLIGLGLVPSYVSTLEKSYSGNIPLALISSYASILDRIYAGGIALVITPSGVYSLQSGGVGEFVYDGQLTLALLSSCISAPDAIYNGNIPINIISDYIATLEKSYGGSLDITIVPSGAYFDLRNFAIKEVTPDIKTAIKQLHKYNIKRTL